jgi:hypothetical protein
MFVKNTGPRNQLVLEDMLLVNEDARSVKFSSSGKVCGVHAVDID